jgi:hypothetical protein
MNMTNFLGELKRRNVYKVAVAYVVAAWLLIQVASIFLPTFEAPAWVMKTFLAFLALGFILSIIISWVFEMTPEGIKRTADISPDEAPDVVRQLEARARQQFVRGYLFALIQAGLGDKTKAIDHLEREYLNQDNIGTTCIQVDPMLDQLRGNPRLETLADRTPETTSIGVEPPDTDDTATGQVDLISGDAAHVKPDLAVREKNGEIHRRVHRLNAMLLDKVFKDHGTMQDVTAGA